MRENLQTLYAAAVRVALAYLEDAEPHPMPAALADASWEEVRESIRVAVRRLR